MSAAAFIPVAFELVEFFRNRRLAKREALPLIEEAEALFDNNESRRRFVAGELQRRLGVSEGQAHDLIQAGMKAWGRIQKKLARRRAKEARRG